MEMVYLGWGFRRAGWMDRTERRDSVCLSVCVCVYPGPRGGWREGDCKSKKEKERERQKEGMRVRN